MRSLIGTSAASGGNSVNTSRRRRSTPSADFGDSAVGTDSDSVQRPSRLLKARRTQAGPRLGGAGARRDDPDSAALDVRTDGRHGFLRSLEQDGVVSKSGAEIRVTVGKPEVIINGESRPLDVPPILYHGDVLVPVRVISEGMGAYVQWVPDRRLVVVRYIPATPPPTEAPPRRPAAPESGTASAAAADTESINARRLSSLVLFHASERVE